MEKLSQLAYHPLKMQSCYEKMEPLRLDGLQQRFDVSSTSVFKQRAQILMREVSPGCYPSSPRTRRPQVPISWGGGPASVAFLPGPLLVLLTGLAAATLGPGVLSAALLSGLFGHCPSAHLANSDSSFGSQRPLPLGGPPCSLSPFPQGPGPLVP